MVIFKTPMKTLSALIMSMTLAHSVYAANCEDSANLKYRCSNEAYVMCVSESERTPGQLEVGFFRHFGSGMTFIQGKLSESKKTLKIKDKTTVLLITIDLLDVRVNKKEKTATFRAFHRQFINIGDGPDNSFDIPKQELICE